jgi:hypothetical protein
MGYLSQLADGRASLLVRSFFNNPSSPYADEPAHLPGGRGDSIYIYNDGGMFSGFGEMECMGQTIGGETGLTTSRDQQLLWLYVGAPETVRSIAGQLLGVFQ